MSVDRRSGLTSFPLGVRFASGRARVRLSRVQPSEVALVGVLLIGLFVLAHTALAQLRPPYNKPTPPRPPYATPAGPKYTPHTPLRHYSVPDAQRPFPWKLPEISPYEETHERLLHLWLANAESVPVLVERLNRAHNSARLARLAWNSPSPGLSADLMLNCLNVKMARFDWPQPPEPTGWTRLHRRYLAIKGDSARLPLGDLFSKLVDRLEELGYTIPPLLATSCNGFAMILPLERLEPDGRRVPGPDGFAEPGKLPTFSFARVIRRLAAGEREVFRRMVIVVDPQGPLGFSAPAEYSLFVELANHGKDALPEEKRSVPAGNDYEIVVLIYEFVEALGQRTASAAKPFSLTNLDGQLTARPGSPSTVAVEVVARGRGRYSAINHLMMAGFVPSGPAAASGAATSRK